MHKTPFPSLTLFFCGTLAGAASFAACSNSTEASSTPLEDAAVPDAAVSLPDAESDSGSITPPTDAEVDAFASPCASDGGPALSLHCTGLYSDLASKTISTDVRFYAPAVPFWSDGAEKERWIWIPPNTKIDTADMDEWAFPTGTKIWKEFKLAGKRIETRLMEKKDAATWQFATYRWNAAETAATLLIDGEKNVNGTTYEIPSVAQCSVCHDGRKDKVLGFEAIGLGLAAAEGLNLAALVGEYKLTAPPSSTTVTLPNGPEGSTAAPALAWLHVNCGVSCHNAGYGSGKFSGLHMKLKAANVWAPEGGATATVYELDTWKTAVGVTSTLQPPGALVTYERIKPSTPGESMIVYFANRREGAGGYVQMPPLGSHIVDTAGVQLLNDWIASIPVF